MTGASNSLASRMLDLIGWPSAPVEAKSSTLDILREIEAATSSSLSGKTVTLQRALEVSAFFAATRVLAEGVAQVPFKLYRRRENGGRGEARDHALFSVLHRRPNEFQTSFEFRETIMFHAVMTGNAFIFINRDTRGRVLELLPFEPGSVTVIRQSDGTLFYRITLADGGQVTLGRDAIWHFRGPSWNGWLGMDAVALARNTIGLSMAAEEFSSNLFRNGARPGGLLLAPETTGPEMLSKIRDQWVAAMSGSGNAMKTAVLSGGLSYQRLSYDADEAQFESTQKAAIRDMCARLRVNPIMVQLHDQSAAYASVEQMFLSHVVHSLMPWYERLEQSAEAALLTPAEQREGLYVKLEAKALMRGTAKERAEFHQIMLQNGVVSRDEVRAAEDMDIIGTPEFATPQMAANLYGPRGPAAGV